MINSRDSPRDYTHPPTRKRRFDESNMQEPSGIPQCRAGTALRAKRRRFDTEGVRSRYLSEYRATQTQSKGFPFLRLPPELRNRIYKIIINDCHKSEKSEPTMNLTHSPWRIENGIQRPPETFALAQTSQQIRQEFRPFLLNQCQLGIVALQLPRFLRIFSTPGSQTFSLNNIVFRPTSEKHRVTNMVNILDVAKTVYELGIKLEFQKPAKGQWDVREAVAHLSNTYSRWAPLVEERGIDRMHLARWSNSTGSDRYRPELELFVHFVEGTEFAKSGACHHSGDRWKCFLKHSANWPHECFGYDIFSVPFAVVCESCQHKCLLTNECKLLTVWDTCIKHLIRHKKVDEGDWRKWGDSISISYDYSRYRWYETDTIRLE